MRRYFALIAALAMLLPVSSASAALGTAEMSFDQVSTRTDEPVATGLVARSWVWGSRLTPVLDEAYAEAPGGVRSVQYFDKARMELGVPGDPIWSVTTGLLAEELITGRMQIGNNTFVQRNPATLPVAGDPDSRSTPTYAALNSLITYQPIPNGWTIIQTVDANGSVAADPRFTGYGVTAIDVGSPTHHTVASKFWEFMTSKGVVYDIHTNEHQVDRLFPNPFYATGYPITEAYWTTTKVAGVERAVLLQCFERRCLTYTPSNPDQWKVEFGNVGRHYLVWRYGDNYQLP